MADRRRLTSGLKNYGPAPKGQTKKKKAKGTDKKQSARFIAAARKLGFESTEKFKDNFKKIVPPKKRSSQ